MQKSRLKSARLLIFCLLFSRAFFPNFIFSLPIDERQAVHITPAISGNASAAFLSVIEKKQKEGTPAVVGYLYIGGHETSISESTWLYIKKGLDFYKKEKPLFILLELNTSGGEVFAAQKICDALKEMDTQFDVPIVAFINDWAISAGAMIAYSCRFIATAKSGSMGAAEPVFAGADNSLQSASEKVNSAIRSDFASKAVFFHRNPLIAEAMVDKEMILVERGGEILQLPSEDDIQKGKEGDSVITLKGKLLTLQAEQMIHLAVADFEIEPRRVESISSEEENAGVWPAKKMAFFYTPPFSSLLQASVVAYKMDWKTKFFVFLTSPLISSLLLMALMVGAYLEFMHPGLTLPGGIAACALFLIGLSSFSLEIADWLELIIMLAGAFLIFFEITLAPTAGLLAILGLFLFLGGLLAMMLPGLRDAQFEFNTQTLNAAGFFVLERLSWLFGSFILSVSIIALLSRFLRPSSFLLRRFTLTGNEQEASRGFVSGDDPAHLPPLGSQATVFATLRPGGKVTVGGKSYDAISVAGFIEKGVKVKIVKVEENTLFVDVIEN